MVIGKVNMKSPTGPLVVYGKEVEKIKCTDYPGRNINDQWNIQKGDKNSNWKR